MSAFGGGRTRAEIERALEDVLRRRELDDDPSALAEVLDWIVEHLLPDLSPEGQAAVVRALQAIGLALLVVLAVALIVALVRRRRRPRAVDARAAVRSRVAELRALAAEARAAGDLALALRYLVFALVVGLGQKGDLSYHAAWTNRELCERGRPGPKAREVLLPLVRELEAKEFGRAKVTEADLDRLEALCDRHVGAEAA